MLSIPFVQLDLHRATDHKNKTRPLLTKERPERQKTFCGRTFLGGMNVVRIDGQTAGLFIGLASPPRG